MCWNAQLGQKQSCYNDRLMSHRLLIYLVTVCCNASRLKSPTLLVWSHFRSLSNWASLELCRAAGQVGLGRRVPYREERSRSAAVCLSNVHAATGLLAFPALPEHGIAISCPAIAIVVGSMVGGDIYLFISLRLCGFMRRSYTWPGPCPSTHSGHAQRSPAKSFRSRLHTHLRMQTVSSH